MANELKKSAAQIQQLLKENNFDSQVIEFTESTRSAQEAANAIGCEVAQIAKSIIFKTKDSERPVSVIASGVNRVDEKKIEKIVGESIVKPDAEFVLKYTGYAIGGIPPIGYHFEISPIIDEDLMALPAIYAAAGTPNAVFKIKPDELVKITKGQIFDIKKIGTN